MLFHEDETKRFILKVVLHREKILKQRNVVSNRFKIDSKIIIYNNLGGFLVCLFFLVCACVCVSVIANFYIFQENRHCGKVMKLKQRRFRQRGVFLKFIA